MDISHSYPSPINELLNVENHMQVLRTENSNSHPQVPIGKIILTVLAILVILSPTMVRLPW